MLLRTLGAALEYLDLRDFLLSSSITQIWEHVMSLSAQLTNSKNLLLALCIMSSLVIAQALVVNILLNGLLKMTLTGKAIKYLPRGYVYVRFLL